MVSPCISLSLGGDLIQEKYSCWWELSLSRTAWCRTLSPASSYQKSAEAEMNSLNALVPGTGNAGSHSPIYTHLCVPSPALHMLEGLADLLVCSSP